MNSLDFNKYINEDSHIMDLFNINCPEDNPYILVEFKNTTLEIINDYRSIQDNSNLQIPKGNGTIAFKLNKTNHNNLYYFLFFQI